MVTLNNVIILISAIVIALTARYIYQNERKMERISARHNPTDDKAGYLFSLKFDRKWTNSALFLSDDNTILGNYFNKETSNPVNHPEQFTNYDGTIGDKCLTSASKIYFEIKFSYEVLVELDSKDLVLEVGVASREKIDINHYVGPHGWSFYISTCETSICLKAQRGTMTIVKIISSSNTAGTVATGRLGFFINMDRNEFSVIDKDSSKILFTFTTVVSADQLCLAFGVYNRSHLQAKLEIMYSYDFTNLPIINVVA